MVGKQPSKEAPKISPFSSKCLEYTNISLYQRLIGLISILLISPETQKTLLEKTLDNTAMLCFNPEPWIVLTERG
jgi:hypothetical protein